MIFHPKGRNILKRPFGRTKQDLTLQTIDIMGLVVGINQPPINNHFHWWHSTLTYQIDITADELRDMIVVKTDKYLYYLEKNGISKIKGKELKKLYYSVFNAYTKKYDKNTSIHYTNLYVSKKVGWNYGRKRIEEED